MCLLASSLAQQTVFNVPSADVLDRGKIYGELDFSYQHSTDATGFTPRIVGGLGRRIEIGINLNGQYTGTQPSTTITPTIKWKAYDGGNNGWAFVIGDGLFVPVQNRTYNLGNYLYAEFTKSGWTGTRVTFGVYHFTPDVVAAANRVGGQFAIEQSISKRITFATDWYTGDHSLGYATPGIIVKITSKLTWYGAYQIGNHALSSGNHQFLTELGWNFN